MLEGINHLAKIIQREGIFNSSEITDVQRKAVKEKVSSLYLNFYLYHNSLDIWQGKVYFLIEREKEKKLVSLISLEKASSVHPIRDFTPNRIKLRPNSLTGFTLRKDSDDGFVADKILNLDGFRVKICSLRHENALVMREIFSYTAPTVLGTEPAFGTGDRIGGKVSATPGHIRALKDYNVAAFFAQQSVRENARTKRTFHQVLDDVTWGVFQEGYKGRWGADADHLMDLASIAPAVDAGFTMFTIDPSSYINDAALNMEKEKLKREWEKLFRTGKEAEDFLKKYLSLREELVGETRRLQIRYDQEQIMRIAVEYLEAIRFTIDAYRIIAQHKGSDNFDFEMSVDETSIPTTPLAHYLIARELNEAKVKLTSLAPRFDAGFEKAVDIRTNDGKKPSLNHLKKFEESVRDHALIARKIGLYKLSIHSGSDKFTAYPIISKYTKGMFHVKTAGTSYLEAVKVVARHNPSLFKEMHQCALETFEENRHTYHLTTNLANVPQVEKLSQREIVEGLTTNDDWRQVIHVAYGVLLDKFGKRMIDVLRENAEDYYETLAEHIKEHLETFGLKKER